MSVNHDSMKTTKKNNNRAKTSSLPRQIIDESVVANVNKTQTRSQTRSDVQTKCNQTKEDLSKRGKRSDAIPSTSGGNRNEKISKERGRSKGPKDRTEKTAYEDLYDKW